MLAIKIMLKDFGTGGRGDMGTEGVGDWGTGGLEGLGYCRTMRFGLGDLGTPD